jgi:hypothetical protein
MVRVALFVLHALSSIASTTTYMNIGEILLSAHIAPFFCSDDGLRFYSDGWKVRPFSIPPLMVAQSR